MELSYWQSKWKKGKIGFHMEQGYPGLRENWKHLELNQPIVFVPLCGKSKDLIFLSDNCQKVIGVEISLIAVQEFLQENNLNAEMRSFGSFKIFRSGNIEIWQGDFFKLPLQKLPSFDLTYDKAALIALPPSKRQEYAAKILEMASHSTKILLHLFEYRQEEMTGPPFSVTVDEVHELFGKQFSIQILQKNYLNLDNYKKFQNRGLNSYFIEILSLLLPNEDKRQY